MQFKPIIELIHSHLNGENRDSKIEEVYRGFVEV